MASFSSTSFDSGSFSELSFFLDLVAEVPDDAEVPREPGGTSDFPMGPGFFIFFQNPTEDIYSGPRDRLNLEAIRRDDQEILELVTMLVRCNEFN